MRERVDADRVRALAKVLGAVARNDTTLYLTGGSTAVMEGWRSSTVDVDLRLEPESDALLRRIAEAKEEFGLNRLDPAERGAAPQGAPAAVVKSLTMLLAGDGLGTSFIHWAQ